MSTGQNARDKSGWKNYRGRLTCCNDCPRKGCGSFHDSCEEYQAQLKKNAEERERVRKTAMCKKPIHTQMHLPKAGGYFKEKRGVR